MTRWMADRRRMTFQASREDASRMTVHKDMISAVVFRNMAFRSDQMVIIQ